MKGKKRHNWEIFLWALETGHTCSEQLVFKNGCGEKNPQTKFAVFPHIYIILINAV